jgi:hypothetical protein
MLNKKICTLCGIVPAFIFRNVFSKNVHYIDVKDSDFCDYLSPSKINFGFFDYYEYYVDWKTNPRPPCYLYWNISLTKIEFITNNTKNKKGGYTYKGKIF